MDRDLVERAQHGDREAFADLAHVCADRLFGLAKRILRDVDRAEDATQQTLEIAWRELPRLRDPDRFDQWINRILVYTCYTEAVRARRWSASVRVLTVEPAAPSDDELTVDDRDQLERGFRRLPPEQRALLALHHYVGLSSPEIAETLGIPAGTVRSRLHYAHEAMRAALEAEERSVAVAGGRFR
jgi:RNA polymerase sigma-70 factor, ECF subfamily